MNRFDQTFGPFPNANQPAPASSLYQRQPTPQQAPQQPPQQSANRPQWPSIGQALGGLFSPSMMQMYAGMALGGTRADQGRLAAQGFGRGQQMAQNQRQFNATQAMAEREMSALEKYRNSQLALKQAALMQGAQSSPTTKLAKLRQDMINGFISQDEFDARRKDILEGRKGPSFQVSPDGTVTYSEYGGLPTPAQNDLAARAVNAERTLASLDTIERGLRDEFLTYYGRGGALLGGVMDRAGLSADQLAQFNAERSRWVQQVDRLFNQYRREITGAAASVQEMRDIRQSILNSDMGPAEFREAMQGLRESMARDIALHNRLVSQGVAPGTTEYNDAFSELSRTRREPYRAPDRIRYNPQTGDFE